MDNLALGKRIREARLSRKMTQSEATCGFITRNMLSQIESGTATPSIKTLEFLSAKLKVPLRDLLADDELVSETGKKDSASSSEDKLGVLSRIKTELRLKNFKGALKLAEDSGVLEFKDGALFDEFAALASIAAFELGKKNKDSELLKKSKELSALGLYANDSRKTAAILALDEL